MNSYLPRAEEEVSLFLTFQRLNPPVISCRPIGRGSSSERRRRREMGDHDTRPLFLKPTPMKETDAVIVHEHAKQSGICPLTERNWCAESITHYTECWVFHCTWEESLLSHLHFYLLKGSRFAFLVKTAVMGKRIEEGGHEWWDSEFLLREEQRKYNTNFIMEIINKNRVMSYANKLWDCFLSQCNNFLWALVCSTKWSIIPIPKRRLMDNCRNLTFHSMWKV